MASERTDELYKALLERGYPKKFCAEIAFLQKKETEHAQAVINEVYRNGL